MTLFKATLVGFLVLIWPLAGQASNALFDGGFESGTLQGWTPTGGAVVATRGTCFSNGDTTQIKTRGQYAGLLRRSDQSPSSFTSKPFIAGTGVHFLGLSEIRGKRDSINPFAIEVSILDGASKVLRSQPMATAMLKLNKGCPSIKLDQSFSAHFVSTREYTGKQIKIRFTQHEEVASTGGFTLIDDVGVIESNLPLYLSFPNARAGVALNNGVVSLTAGLPGGALEQTRPWVYSWFINGESSERPYFNPCVNDLEPGEYTANLYVYNSNNNQLATDTFYFLVPDEVDSSVEVPDPGSATPTSTTAVTDLSESASCNQRHPLDLVFYSAAREHLDYV